MGVERTPLMKEIPREASAEEMSQSEGVPSHRMKNTSALGGKTLK